VKARNLCRVRRAGRVWSPASRERTFFRSTTTPRQLLSRARHARPAVSALYPADCCRAPAPRIRHCPLFMDFDMFSGAWCAGSDGWTQAQSEQVEINATDPFQARSSILTTASSMRIRITSNGTTLQPAHQRLCSRMILLPSTLRRVYPTTYPFLMGSLNLPVILTLFSCTRLILRPGTQPGAVRTRWMPSLISHLWCRLRTVSAPGWRSSGGMPIPRLPRGSSLPRPIHPRYISGAQTTAAQVSRKFSISNFELNEDSVLTVSSTANLTPHEISNSEAQAFLPGAFVLLDRRRIGRPNPVRYRPTFFLINKPLTHAHRQSRCYQRPSS
jgi:hypothetical protein